jgi:hypothetical protein
VADMGRSKSLKVLRRQMNEIEEEYQEQLQKKPEAQLFDLLPLIGPWLYSRKIKHWQKKVDLGERMITLTSRQVYQKNK